MMSVCGNSLGPLSLTTVLGRGGMGLVWNASSPDCDGAFAVKMLAGAPEPADRARFEREADILERLDSDGVVKLRDRGETDDGIPFVVMDRIAGRSVDRILARKKLLTVRETASILVPLLRTLAEVHRAGISHRDIKPGNIMVHRSGPSIRVTLIDFGLAGLQWDEASVEPHVVGTVHYMSPEQAWNAGKPTPEADLWSVAVVAYECLTGRMPFDGESLNDVFRALDRGVFPAVTRYRPDLGAEVDALFARAFSRQLADRFTTAKELSCALSALPWADDHVPHHCRAACSRDRGHDASRTRMASSDTKPAWGSGWFKRIEQGAADRPFTTSNRFCSGTAASPGQYLLDDADTEAEADSETGSLAPAARTTGVFRAPASARRARPSVRSLLRQVAEATFAMQAPSNDGA